MLAPARMCVGQFARMQLAAPASTLTPSRTLPVRDDATFLPQFRSPGLPDGMPWGPDNGNCGPASLVNALRLVGLDVPGFSGERTQAVIDAARMLITGTNDPTAPTTKAQQAVALQAAGAEVTTTRSLDAGLEAVRKGAVLLLGGDRAAPTWPRRSDDPPPTRVANHAAVVARYEPATSRYVVFDPALDAPVRVDAAQLAAFTQVTDGANMLRLGLVVRGPHTRPASQG
ncbi:MAG: hypothetical protein JWL76_50 [Thermoleophilia bacterium]|nr:hypothetical protein [Thermoleophilia bacterium]